MKVCATQEDVFMKIDEIKGGVSDEVSAADEQNRREFFNGLGKWSMIVVAAVSFLRGSVTQTYAGSEGTERPEWQPQGTPFRRIAKGKHHQHVDIPGGHGDAPHQDVAHVDQNIMRQDKGQPSGQPSGPPPAKMYE
jgi:hypothetical protein